MRCIPGSERLSGKDEEHITSIARFEALMQEVDERKQQKCAGRNSVEANDSWDLDDEFEKASSEVAEEEGRDDDDDKDVNGLEIPDQEIVIPTPAQRALEYISGRQAPLLSKRRTRPPSPNPLSPTVPSVNPQAVSAFHGDELHPSKGITNPPPRPSRPAYLALPSRSVSTPTIPSHQDNTSSSTSTSSFRPGTTNELGGTNGKGKEDQISGSCVKRPTSFSEFAKRLSSSSSLLLVQTNASVGSSSGREGSMRGSSEFGAELADERDGGSAGLRNSVSLRGGGMPASATAAAGGEGRDKRCVWRGSLGVFGGEGGFL